MLTNGFLGPGSNLNHPYVLMAFHFQTWYCTADLYMGKEDCGTIPLGLISTSLLFSFNSQILKSFHHNLTIHFKAGLLKMNRWGEMILIIILLIILPMVFIHTRMISNFSKSYRCSTYLLYKEINSLFYPIFSSFSVQYMELKTWTKSAQASFKLFAYMF